MEKKERIYLIDGIRGFSLFGILLANLLIFQYGIFGMDELYNVDLKFLDHKAFMFSKVIIEGSFMPIFTFLFGYSLIIMRDSLKRNDLRVKWHLFRRSLLLIGLGLLHGIFLWEGDILTLYGMMGISLLIFVNRKAKTTLIWAIILSVIFVATLLLGSFVDYSDHDYKKDSTVGEEIEEYSESDWEAYIQETNDIYANGTYSEIKKHRNDSNPLTDKFDGSGIKKAVLSFLLPVFIGPLFLFGMYAAKIGSFTRPTEEKKKFILLTLIFIPIGLGLKIYAFFFSDFYEASSATELGGPLLAVGYIFLLGWIYSLKKQPRILKGFESIGKMSLTNYLMQSLVCTTIFYGYGIGLFGKLGLFYGILLGILIYTFQMIASTYYLKKFNYGPIESLVRIGTYLSFKPSKKKNN